MTAAHDRLPSLAVTAPKHNLKTLTASNARVRKHPQQATRSLDNCRLRTFTKRSKPSSGVGEHLPGRKIYLDSPRLMRILMRCLKMFTAVVAVTTVVLVRPAAALPQFQKVFFTEYINDHGNAEFAEMVKTEVKCFICHQGKKKKKNRNPYGMQLSELLDKKKDKKDVDKISAALKKVGDMPSNPKDPNSETYAERIAAGKLPAADNLEDLKVEPKDSDEE